jgi:aminoglycoside phosphotransferase (APT) family kinase protein
MAIVNSTDPAQLRGQLTEWLSRTVGDGLPVQVANLDSPPGSGLSNEIFTFDATWGDGPPRGMVARIEPVVEKLFPSYDLEMEHRLMSVLGRRTAVPVPPVIGVETDAAVLGAPFLVMGRVEGRVPSDDPPFTVAGWVTELDDSTRANLFQSALSQLADIHRLDWRDLGLGFLDHPEWGEPGLEQQLGYIVDLAGWVLRGRTNPVIDAALEWVRSNRPTDPEPLVLNWGDARPGNMIFAADGSVAAVLDWEMATIASPELDLGLWLFLQRHHTEGIGASLPAGFLDHEQTAQRYEELTGHRPGHLDYYEAFAGLRAAIVMSRFADQMEAAGILPPGSEMWTNNPASQLLASMLGLPAPSGATGTFIGQRGR